MVVRAIDRDEPQLCATLKEVNYFVRSIDKCFEELILNLAQRNAT